jgi:hypothetical protein
MKRDFASALGSGWRRQAVVAALVAGLLVAGCSGGDEPVEEPLDPGSSPGAIYTGEPLPKPTPVMPAEAREHTLEGAEATMRYYLDMYGYAFAVSDSSGLKPLADKRCRLCTTAISWVDDNRKNGTRNERGTFSVRGAEAGWITRDTVATVTAQVHQAAAQLVSRDGTVLDSSPDDDVIMTFTLEWGSSPSGWRVIDVKVKP